MRASKAKSRSHAVKTAPSAKASSEPEAASATGDKDKEDPAFVLGQKYLYGQGVPQSCSLAEKNLRISAQNSNFDAQSMLGAMYATGHCVAKDLPAAYRWFARASHLQPNNARIEQDLEVLWRQMTAEEKQTAIRR
jgi:TPR repeat protein